MIEAMLKMNPQLDILMVNAICSAYEAGTLTEILENEKLKEDEEKNSIDKVKE